MRGPFELRSPIARRHQDRDLGLLWRKAGAEPDMRAELVGVVGEARALQPDMDRRPPRAARARFAPVPHPALPIVDLGFLHLLVARPSFLSVVGVACRA